jgi:hypothetical protein
MSPEFTQRIFHSVHRASIRSRTSFARLRLGELFFELVHPLLQRR